MKKSKFAMLALCGVLVCGGAIGAYSYYNGQSNTTNNPITIKAGAANATGTDVGEIDEGDWDPTDAENLNPNDEVTKQPSFTSNVNYTAWVFMKVDIPARDMMIDDDTVVSCQDMVTLVDVDTANWTLVDSNVCTVSPGKSSYIYGYKTKVDGGGSTSQLFQAIKVQNITYLEDDLNDSVDVSVAIIQASQEYDDAVDPLLAAYADVSFN